MQEYISIPTKLTKEEYKELGIILKIKGQYLTDITTKLLRDYIANER